MVYGRTIAGKELSFEASGGLKNASLIMRDRESDSWWSLMTSKGIEGEFEDVEIPKLAGGEKTTFGEWRKRHPETLVLSVGGAEHDESNPYENYLGNDRVFRENTPEDDRLPPKQNIYSFHSAGKAFAVAHESIEGGARYDVGLEGGVLLLYREAGSSSYASTEAYLADPESSLETILERRGQLARYNDGFDTFWYSWIWQNPGSEILR